MERPESDIRVREACEGDVEAIIRLFQASYGAGYMYPQFYEETSIKKLVFSDDALVLVAEAPGSDEIVGTASVVLEIGAYSDLVGEFGRLVVLPEARNRGVGGQLMAGRLERVRARLHVGLVEARTAHPFSCRIADRHGFAAVGVMPNRLLFGGNREHATIYARYFGDALTMRDNHPRIIPEVFEIASMAMENVGLEPDVIVDEPATPYPAGGSCEIEPLEADGYSSLLRIQRARARRREVFGPLRLHYGFFKLRATRAKYLIARRGGGIAGAVGFIRDDHEKHVRIFELIHLHEDIPRILLSELDRLAGEEWGTATIEADIDADSPRMQRTLLEIGYRPACYLPAYAFHRAERRDVVKMWRLFDPPVPLAADLPEHARGLTRMVLESFERQEMRPRIRHAMEHVGLFEGLSEEQAAWLGSLLRYRSIERGEALFTRGDRNGKMYLVIEGALTIEVDGAPLGTVGPGECVGEVALLSGQDHSATAVATETTVAGLLTREDLTRLVRRRPDIGVTLYRNLAAELGEKLRRADFDEVS
jgi:RimJ/RimL family protein N-acetyltransferase